MAQPGNEHLAGLDPVHFGSKRDRLAFTGQFVRTDEGATQYGRSPVFVFAGEPERILWGFHTGLQRAWREAAPQPGETVTIIRSEDRIPFGTDGRAAYEYAVNVARAEPVSAQIGADDEWPEGMF